MRFSVVTISYNQARFLERSLDSVLGQEGAAVEYIVVDACSSDGSREILERYRPRLARLVIEKDRGPADGLNKGFAAATGDILYYLNSDDVALPGAFAQVADVLAKHPGCDVVYGDGHVIDEDGRRLRPSRSMPRFSPYRYLSGAGAVFQQATFFRRAAFERVRGFNTENTSCWDGELLLDMALAGSQFLHVPRAWGEFRISSDSISGSGRLLAQYAIDRERMFRKVMGRNLTVQDLAARYAYRLLDRSVLAFV